MPPNLLGTFANKGVNFIVPSHTYAAISYDAY